jgi:hypothetical protein
MLVDYRLHPAILATEDRVRGSREHFAPAERAIRRVFRVGEGRPTSREMGRR